MLRVKLSTLVLAAVTLAAPAALDACAQSVRQEEKPVVVLGAESLKAAEAEARRKERGDTGRSPMPAGEYRFSREELGLVNPKPNEFDAALAELARRYAQSDAAARARMRHAIDMEQLYMLLEFADRAAVFALRERSAARVTDGLSAVALVEQERVDYRGILWTLATLHHSAARIGANPAKLFRDAAALAEPQTAELILGFLKQPAKDKDLRDAWGRVEVETEGGVGLMGWGFKKYAPTGGLKRVAVDVARLVVADKYEQVSAKVGEELPRHWLETNDNAVLDRALRSARAGASIHASYGRYPDSAIEKQVLMIFLVELSSEAEARALLSVAARKKPYDDDAVLAVAEGRLFCLLVAKPGFGDEKNEETPEGVRRFSAGLSEILRRYAQG